MARFIVAGTIKIGDRTDHNVVMRENDFRRYMIKMIRRHRTIERKMEQERKKLDRELWEVFGI